MSHHTHESQVFQILLEDGIFWNIGPALLLGENDLELSSGCLISWGT